MSSFLNPSVSLNQCLGTVGQVCFDSGHSGSDTAVGNFIRVHLAQAAYLRFDPNRLEKILRSSPQESILGIDSRLGNRERAVRYLSIGRWMLAIYGFSQKPEASFSVEEAVYCGCHVYRLAADASASFDLDYADIWWAISQGFPRYGEIVDATCQILAT